MLFVSLSLGHFSGFCGPENTLTREKKQVIDDIEHKGRSGINQVKKEAEFASHLSGDYEMEQAPAWMIFRTHIVPCLPTGAAHLL